MAYFDQIRPSEGFMNFWKSSGYYRDKRSTPRICHSVHTLCPLLTLMRDCSELYQPTSKIELEFDHLGVNSTFMLSMLARTQCRGSSPALCGSFIYWQIDWEWFGTNPTSVTFGQILWMIEGSPSRISSSNGEFVARTPSLSDTLGIEQRHQTTVDEAGHFSICLKKKFK